MRIYQTTGCKKDGGLGVEPLEPYHSIYEYGIQVRSFRINVFLLLNFLHMSYTTIPLYDQIQKSGFRHIPVISSSKYDVGIWNHCICILLQSMQHNQICWQFLHLLTPITYLLTLTFVALTTATTKCNNNIPSPFTKTNHLISITKPTTIILLVILKHQYTVNL